ncbi:dee77c75-a6f6-43f4-b50e-55c7e1c23a1c [Sclerotinia trifoliorum]|uniref:Dee77c75-a6f6-43f4-b50e-55c7e1c23a1c n=1 Tax=Sclerotinia trifoliorum TaxID=28548 RepID=A0A8H2VLS6_9HELO|nr:dee77c75-a6f6-43f4-b50e-55c7e1c23a1c [Sclerotinia trifoliorum]
MIVILALRVFQLLFATIVLALSVIMIKGYGPGLSWLLIIYGSFCGGAAIIIGVIGIVACFMEALQGTIMLVLDCVASFFLLAGGIAYAATIKVGNCDDFVGYVSHHNNPFSFSAQRRLTLWESIDEATTRCRETQASTAFLWFTAACFIGTTVIHFLGRKRGGGAVSYP